ncbi:N-acetylmuramic acid 6-phosphate etherase MurQ [Penicillium expansum]|uniref:N-acetyl-D-glucosamine kinase n=1 Tax=Penicillium expansum TaxID=27334 RepID=A0A0A2IIZ4_PENEN|nr:N-acetylmuramic acid 6-phosphate etherase MurQ [Penicillium expansum]KGO42408.1 N-acetylmuramic acid 6-phosphate etherase MurQ [Penicillium expansum]KGO56450.1 N-acetylmuramic acid 6-phosphate etherase MurQ [Penicillium expansum]
MSTLDMCTVINADDQKVPESVVPSLPVIAGAIDALTPRVRQGGRVIYVGAGTSGRLGILDASEIPPTFAAPRGQFVGLIAGGDAAIREAQEGAEDDEKAGEDEMKSLNLNPELDSIIGIASSGRTPYVLGCLAFAKRLGCVTIAVVCTVPSAISLSGNVDFVISPVSGPEVVTGSTRLKAGTVTKLVLNMLSTGTMIRTGKTYGNMMVDLVASNLKLVQRSRNILRRLSGKCQSSSNTELDALLARCNASVKLAILVAETGESVETCQGYFDAAGGVLANALAAVSKPIEQKPTSTPTQKFVLCIDGGGTKCAAVVADGINVVGQGFAGPCNLTDSIGNIDGVIATLLDATKAALKDALPSDVEQTESSWKERLQASFSSVWVGLAGIDRAGLEGVLAPKLRQAFGITQEKDLQLTNDVDLLTAGVPQSLGTPSVLVVIAGTGSVAMRYKWAEDQQRYTRSARSGGWGHMLGDQGGGYTIGLKAIQHTLGVFEDITLGLDKTGGDEFSKAVAEKLGCQVSESTSIDMLNNILGQTHSQGVKARIASIAPVVLNFMNKSETATDIVSSQVALLVGEALGRLVKPQATGYQPPEASVLVLAGGLMKNERYRATFEKQLDTHRLYFRGTVVVEDVARSGATYLCR